MEKKDLDNMLDGYISNAITELEQAIEEVECYANCGDIYSYAYKMQLYDDLFDIIVDIKGKLVDVREAM